jgi:hypothetical protein
MKSIVGKDITGIYAFLAGVTATIAIGVLLWFYVGQAITCGGHI